MLLQRLAALINPDRLVERHIATLEILNDLLQRLERLLEAHALDVAVGFFGHLLSLQQTADMRSDRHGKPLQVVPTFKQADNPPL